MPDLTPSDTASPSDAAPTDLVQSAKFRSPSLTPQASGTMARLIGVDAVNQKVAWVSGVDGTFAVTTDGGATWHPGVVPGAEALQFREVGGVSATEAYLLSIGPGADSRVYHTTDGGESWHLQFQGADPDAFYDCFAFWTPNRGFAYSDGVDGRFPVIRTTDGETWQDIGDNLPAAQPGRGFLRRERYLHRRPGWEARVDRHRRPGRRAHSRHHRRGRQLDGVSDADRAGCPRGSVGDLYHRLP